MHNLSIIRNRSLCCLALLLCTTWLGGACGGNSGTSADASENEDRTGSGGTGGEAGSGGSGGAGGQAGSGGTGGAKDAGRDTADASMDLAKDSADGAVDTAADISADTIPDGGIDVPTSSSKLTITPRMKNFGTVMVGQTSASAATFEVKNTGGSTSGVLAAGLLGTNPGEFAKVSDDCNIELAPGASCTVTVNFAPTSAGDKIADLAVYTAVVGKEMAVLATLQGTGVAAARFTVNPIIQSFGSVVKDQSSLAVEFTVSNAGGLATGVPVVMIAGDQFVVISNQCTAALAPGATCKVKAQFSPTVLGAHSGALNVSAPVGAPGGTASASLSGTGIAPAGLMVTPSLKDFGLVLVDTSSAATTFTITNTGGVPATGLDSGITLSSQFTISANTCTATLAPAGTCAIDVKFSPTARGTKSGTLTIAPANAPSITAAVSGEGQADALLWISPTTRNYGSGTVGSASAALGFTITNKGDVTSGTLTTTVTGANNHDFNIVSTGCTGALAPAGSCQIDITFNPSAIGARAAVLTVSGTPGGVVTANINGVGVPTTVNIKAFLQGPYDTTTHAMRTSLYDQKIIPLAQPYNIPPWNFGGSEVVREIPKGAVDWVLVEIRSGSDATKIIDTRAGFIMFDGTIFDTDGQSPVGFGIPEGKYYVVLRHRNHLAIMTADSIALSPKSEAYDFSTKQSQAYGNGSAMIEAEAGIFALRAGDVNASGIVTTADLNLLFGQLNSTGYEHSGDTNLSGIVTAADVQFVNANLNANSQVPALAP